MLLQLEEDHLPGRAELCSLSDLDWPEGKTNDHNLSHTHTERKYEESDRKAEKDATSCSSVKNCIYKFLLWRICGRGI